MKQEQGPRWMILITLVAVMAAGVLIATRYTGRKPPGITSNAYYYDLNTGELFAASSSLLPPIDAPSGALHGTDNQQAGVRAYVFTCGGDTVADRYIAWIETYAPEAHRALTDKHISTSHPLMRQANGSPSPIVARINPDSPADVHWVGSESPQGVDIIRNNTSACAEGSAPVPCVPQ